jgi:DNA invertase Pin-like site-specific DNA recombinase
MRAVIYVRISRDAEGTSLGVERQKKLCRAIIKQQGWELVAEPYEDNDVSATSTRARPAFERMLRDLATGRFDVIVALDSDRLLRKMGDLQRVFDLCEQHRVQVRYQSGGFNPVTGDGMLEAEIRASVDGEEVRKLKRRVKRKARELAEAGKIGGGGTRPYGYHDYDEDTKLCRCCEPGVASEQFGVTVRGDEAAEIRKAVRRIIDNGWTFYGVCADWEHRGVLAPSGLPWNLGGLKRMLLSPRIAGLRQHTTTDAHGRKTVETFPAVWPAIVSDEDHELLKKRGERPPRRKSSKYLLSGGILFSSTGDKMNARPRGDGARAYHCEGFRCLADPLEGFVVEQVLTTLEESPKTFDRLTKRPGQPKDRKVFKALDDERGRLERIHELYEEGAYTKARYEAKRDECQRTITSLVAQLDANGAAPLTLPRSGAAIRTWWEKASFDDRRLLLKLCLRKVVLKPAVAGRNFFDPDRVRLDWLV